MKKVVLACVFVLAIVATALVSVAGSEATAEPRPVLVVTTFDAKGVGVDDVEFVMDVFTSNFANMGFADIDARLLHYPCRQSWRDDLI